MTRWTARLFGFGLIVAGVLYAAATAVVVIVDGLDFAGRC